MYSFKCDTLVISLYNFYKTVIKGVQRTEFIVRAIFLLMSLISANFLPLGAVFTSGKQKQCLVWGQVCKLNGRSAPQTYLPGKPSKRNRQLFFQSCGLTPKVPINNLSSNCILNSLITVYLSALIPCVPHPVYIKGYQYHSDPRLLKAKFVVPRWGFCYSLHAPKFSC